ncbi:deaminase domain-containing protein [Nocardia donostiensis]
MNAPRGTELPSIAPPSTGNAIVPAHEPPQGLRQNDAENNMLEHLHRQIEETYPAGPDGINRVTGHVRLFVEQTPCPSCSDTIDTFRRMYPDLQIEVFYVTSYPPVRKDRPTL